MGFVARIATAFLHDDEDDNEDLCARLTTFAASRCAVRAVVTHLCGDTDNDIDNIVPAWSAVRDGRLFRLRPGGPAS